jgi:Tfp pilus assembly protein PilF
MIIFNKKFNFTLKVLLTFFIVITNGFASETNYLKEGIKFYKENKIEQSKIFFEKDIVFNPKSEKAYLYLAKIFSKTKKDAEQEVNLKNVLLLNPENEEATYLLASLKIKQFNYQETRVLIDKFIIICKSLCSKKKELTEKFQKLNPENEKNFNQ